MGPETKPLRRPLHLLEAADIPIVQERSYILCILKTKAREQRYPEFLKINILLR